MPQSTQQFPSDLFLWSEIARNFGILIAGIFGLWIAWWRSRAANLQAQAALEQNDLARRDHITELFNRAVGQLTDDKLEVKLGAIYTLRAICEDRSYQPYTGPITRTLSAYVRGKSAEYAENDMPEDVVVIIEWLHADTGADNAEGGE